MIIKCTNPDCRSENVTRQSADSNDFICDDCGNEFSDEDDDELDNEDNKVIKDNEDEFDDEVKYDDSLIMDDHNDEEEED
jgi:hypothetical protein